MVVSRCRGLCNVRGHSPHHGFFSATEERLKVAGGKSAQLPVIVAPPGLSFFFVLPVAVRHARHRLLSCPPSGGRFPVFSNFSSDYFLVVGFPSELRNELTSCSATPVRWAWLRRPFRANFSLESSAVAIICPRAAEIVRFFRSSDVKPILSTKPLNWL